MKGRFLTVASLAMVLLAAGCAAPPRDTVFQASTIDALLAGVYDGELTCRELLRHGDLGIGTFDRLDGEMVLLDGELFQVRADGSVRRPDPALRTPFAAVCRFEPGSAVPVAEGSDRAVVEALLDRQCPNPNLFYAIRLTGRFAAVTTRSVPAQDRPYRPLVEVTAHQPEFAMTDVEGTVLGFRCPAFVKGVNVPGWHLHFISRDRARGGHVLSFTVAAAACEVDALHRLLLTLPAGSDGFARTDLSRDRSGELMDVERND